MDFSWLNDVPDKDWKPWGPDMWYLEMEYEEFSRRSKAEPGEDWGRAFRSWGFRQRRKYDYSQSDKLAITGFFRK